jgi:hypothetical protein
MTWFTASFLNSPEYLGVPIHTFLC